MRLQKVSVTELKSTVREDPVAPLRVGSTNNPVAGQANTARITMRMPQCIMPKQTT